MKHFTVMSPFRSQSHLSLRVPLLCCEKVAWGSKSNATLKEYYTEKAHLDLPSEAKPDTMVHFGNVQLGKRGEQKL